MLNTTTPFIKTIAQEHVYDQSTANQHQHQAVQKRILEPSHRKLEPVRPQPGSILPGKSAEQTYLRLLEVEVEQAEPVSSATSSFVQDGYRLV